jgi:alpha-glucosidase (family GH31 glycosyl hydrolase)
MRPMVLEFPDDENTYGIDDQFMVGNALVVKGIYSKDSRHVEVYLPKTEVMSSERWQILI